MQNEILSENFKNLTAVAEKNNNNFLTNQPFPHISFDNFFNLSFIDTILSDFPDLEKKTNTKEFDTTDF